MKAGGLRFVLVVARYNEIVTKLLLEGALDTLRRYSVNEEDIDVVWVPGSFEIGVAAQSLGKSGKYHAVLCIGVVIKGDTSHYDAVVNSATSGVLLAGLNSGVPCIFGVLTCDDMDEALNRAGGKAGNKGSEIALIAEQDSCLREPSQQRSAEEQSFGYVLCYLARNSIVEQDRCCEWKEESNMPFKETNQKKDAVKDNRLQLQGSSQFEKIWREKTRLCYLRKSFLRLDNWRE